MPQARGSQMTVALFEESVYGVDPGAPVGKKIYVKAFTGGATQALLTPETLTGARVRSAPARGNNDVAFALPVELSAESHGTLFKHALGAVTTTGANPYEHVIIPGALPVGLVVERDFGSNISDSGRYEKFNGVRIGSLDIEIPQSGYISGVFNFVGAKATPGATPLDATLDDFGHTPFSSFSASLAQEGGVSTTLIKSAKIKIDNDLDADGYTINPAAPGTRSQLPEGFSTVSGEIVAVFDSVTLLNKAINSTASSLLFAFSRGNGLGSTGNEYMEFFVGNLIFERKSPEVPGPKGIVVTLAFQGYGATQLRVILKNAQATI